MRLFMYNRIYVLLINFSMFLTIGIIDKVLPTFRKMMADDFRECFDAESVLELNGQRFKEIERIAFMNSKKNYVRIMSLLAIGMLVITLFPGCGYKKISKEMKSKYDGGWYGWTCITEADGDWVGSYGMCYDVVGNFTYKLLDLDGKSTEIAQVHFGTLQEPDFPIVEFLVNIRENDEWDAGEVYTMGYSCDFIQHSYRDDFGDVLVITCSADTGTGRITTMTCCRKWGTKWDDVEASCPENLPYTYNSWYVPYIEAGNSMPTEGVEVECISQMLENNYVSYEYETTSETPDSTDEGQQTENISIAGTGLDASYTPDDIMKLYIDAIANEDTNAALALHNAEIWEQRESEGEVFALYGSWQMVLFQGYDSYEKIKQVDFSEEDLKNSAFQVSIPIDKFICLQYSVKSEDMDGTLNLNMIQQDGIWSVVSAY